MENGIIEKLSKLETHYVDQTIALLVDSFYYMFTGISKDREILHRLFNSCIQTDLVYVLLHNNQIAGFIAVSDFRRRAILIHEDACVGIFGALKGKFLAWQLQKIFSEPAVKEQNQGYIDFIATSPEFKRCGVATQLLTYVEQNTDFGWIYLDVLVSNHSAIRLYEKSGYTIDKVKKNIWMRLAGIKAMNIMKKKVKLEKGYSEIGGAM